MNSKSPLHEPFKKKSLNRESRKKSLEKIAGDNQAILKRLQCRTPVYSTQKWEKEWKETEKRLKNMSEFPSKHSSSRPRVTNT
jgi:Hemingway/CFA97